MDKNNNLDANNIDHMKFVSELLYKHECVIIPGFGGFITDYSPARFNKLNNSVTPPTKQIMFNAQLKNNDGLLANHITVTRNLSYEEANEVIRRFVDKCSQLLKQGSKLRFPEVGMISQNNEGGLEFEPDIQANYLEDTFGMSSLIAPPVIRTSRQDEFEKAFKKRTTIPKERVLRLPKAIKWVAVAIPFVAAGFWGISNLDKIDGIYDQYADYFSPLTGQSAAGDTIEDQLMQKRAKLDELKTNQAGIFSPTFDVDDEDDQDFVTQEENITDEELNAIMSTIERVQMGDDQEEIPLAESDIITHEPAPSILTADFYVIVGAYQDRATAQNLVDRLINMGYPAEITGKSASGLYRVSAIQGKNEKDAQNKLKIVRSEDFPSAWLLKL